MKTNEVKQPNRLKTVTCINKKRLIHYDSHKVYTETHKRKVPKYMQARTRKEFLDIIKEFYKVVAEELVNREGGVCIKELGYFFIWKIPKKMHYDLPQKGGGYKTHFNFHTNHTMYSPILIPTHNMKYWYLDKAFNSELKDALRDQIYAGKTYKMYAHTLKQLKKYRP